MKFTQRCTGIYKYVQSMYKGTHMLVSYLIAMAAVYTMLSVFPHVTELELKMELTRVSSAFQR